MSQEQPNSNTAKRRSTRKIKNFLLMPQIQIRLGAYMIALASLLFAALTLIIYLKMGEIVEIIVQLTDIEEEVKDVLLSYVGDMSWWIVLAIFVYIIANLALSIIYTHKMVGPTYAFRRQIKQLSAGNYHAKVKLRKGDAFVEIADELNHLAKTLEHKSTNKESC